MKLTNFQIKNYKVIHDTKTVKVDPRVTSLVGKNESGKTAVKRLRCSQLRGLDWRASTVRRAWLARNDEASADCF